MLKVTLHHDPENKKVRYFRVKVSSVIWKAKAATLRVYPGGEGLYTVRDVRVAIGLAGGECAEYCCEFFGDCFEPQDYAKAALVALDRLCEGLKNGTETVHTGGYNQGYGPDA